MKRMLLVIGLILCANYLQAAEPLTAKVTRQVGERTLTYAGGLDTVLQGLLTALLGSSNIVTEAAAADWQAALKEDHLRVVFPAPQNFVISQSEGKLPVPVSEIVLSQAPERSPHRFMSRDGDKYYVYGKYDGHIWVLLSSRYLNDGK